MNKRESGRAIIIDNDEVILMFRRKIIDGITKEYYAIPGGGIETGETKEAATIREIKEEFNLDIEILSYLGTVEDEKNIGYVFNTKIIGGNLKLGGEELEHNNESNYYEIQRIKLNEIDNIELFEENRKLIEKAAKERGI
ncbi:MAG: NUDIX hydrolase [Candidatus Coprovivens sp.]